ncbi:MAG TPA: hypothetical protein VN788_05225 [Verrucomicrobiae bacterium]|nr:hypothetical protein [Verrucomicrobiae bacterium]
MRHAAFLLGAVLLFSTTSSAQDTSANPLLFAPFDPGLALAEFSSVPTEPLVLASAAGSASTEPTAAPAIGAEPSSEPPAQQPRVFGVFETYKWQAYVGYAFFRFFALPRQKENMNGIDLGAVYYPTASRIGVDGDILGQFGTFHNQSVNQSSKFTAYMGGPRFRWQAPRGIELWAHGLAGFAKFLPQTAHGGQLAFSYEAGGGVDIGAFRRRIGYRIEVDAVGTHFFHTNQVSPKITFGVVYKF